MLAYSALGGTGLSSIAADAPPVAFDTKALVVSGKRQQERNATLLLADGKIMVTPDDTPRQPLYVVTYRQVRSVTYSRSRDPMWKSPQGAAPVVRSSGGMLGKFGISVARHWIVLQSDAATEFFVLRVEEAQARRILTEIAERTGITPATIGGS